MTFFGKSNIKFQPITVGRLRPTSIMRRQAGAVVD